MIVYLLRHGEAEGIGAGAAHSDAARRLTNDGKRRLEQAAASWRRCVGDIDRVYTSPLVRARQTAVVFAEALGHRQALQECEWLLPEAEPELAARVALADAAADCNNIAFVGHEPHLGELLAMLLLGRGAIPLKKGMLVGIELQGPTVASGRLVACLTTKLAGRLEGS